MQKILDMMYKIFYIVSEFLGVPSSLATRRQPHPGVETHASAWRVSNVIHRHLRRLAPLAGLAALTLAAPALAQHSAVPEGHGKTANLQGGDQQHWINDPHMHAWFDTTRAAFANGPGKVDVDGYEQKSFAIFRDFAPAMHMTPEGMVDHLKLIPRQVVQIVKEDPHVLDNYDNFVAATFGPQ